MMINVLSAGLPGRCVTLTHRHASAAGMSDMLKFAAGQARYQEKPMMERDKMALTSQYRVHPAVVIISAVEFISQVNSFTPVASR